MLSALNYSYGLNQSIDSANQYTVRGNLSLIEQLDSSRL